MNFADFLKKVKEKANKWKDTQVNRENKSHQRPTENIQIILEKQFFEDFEGIGTFHFKDNPTMSLTAGIFTSDLADVMNEIYVGTNYSVVLSEDKPMELHLEAISLVEDSIEDGIHIIETNIIDKVAIIGTFFSNPDEYYIKSEALPCPLILEYNDALCDTMEVGKRYQVIGGLWLYVYEWEQNL